DMYLFLQLPKRYKRAGQLSGGYVYCNVAQLSILAVEAPAEYRSPDVCLSVGSYYVLLHFYNSQTE
ncbi:hypothetical protein J6590_041964, partial [Homalodisca vitripennis]